MNLNDDIMKIFMYRTHSCDNIACILFCRESLGREVI